MISHRGLLKRLRTFAKAANANVERINSGGCGVIAGIVGTHLQEMGFECEVVTPVRGDYDLPAAKVRDNIAKTKRNDPLEWDRNGLSRTHLALRFISSGRTYTWDTDGLLCTRGRFGTSCANVRGYLRTDSSFGSGMTVEECVAISSKQEGWNRLFDRNHIPLLETLAAYHIKHGL